MRRRRGRAITLVTGTTLCVMIAVAFVVSAWWQVAIQFGHAVCFGVTGGSILILLDDALTIPVELERHSHGLYRWNAWHFDWGWWFIEAPLYAVFTSVAIPTLLRWRFWPKFPRGHCVKCGYNLTGNVSGRCPECGAAVSR